MLQVGNSIAMDWEGELNRTVALTCQGCMRYNGSWSCGGKDTENSECSCEECVYHRNISTCRQRLLTTISSLSGLGRSTTLLLQHRQCRQGLRAVKFLSTVQYCLVIYTRRSQHHIVHAVHCAALYRGRYCRDLHPDPRLGSNRVELQALGTVSGVRAGPH